MESGFDSRLTGRAVALISLVAVTWAAGCGELPESTGLASQEAPMTRMDNCPTGTCNGTGNNGKGLFIASNLSYCFPIAATKRFCPEHFSNDADAEGVTLTGSIHDAGYAFPTGAVTLSFEATGEYRGLPAAVKSFSANSQGITVTVMEGPTELLVTGSQLSDLILELSGPFEGAVVKFSMRFAPALPENGVALYQAEYQLDGSSTWQPYCSDSAGTVAFLPERWVDGESGHVSPGEPSAAMSCRSGAVATCMEWGYRPWEASPEEQNQADYLYGACLQAKRAAYFVASGDYNSYTVNGTHIAIHDRELIKDDTMPGVEAVWGPGGAVCFSPEYRRIPSPGSQLPALPAVLPVPECNERLHESATLGQLWQHLPYNSPLATGPVPD
jgi:hypothetical protein